MLNSVKYSYPVTKYDRQTTYVSPSFASRTRTYDSSSTAVKRKSPRASCGTRERLPPRFSFDRTSVKKQDSFHETSLVHRERWKVYLSADRHRHTKYNGREYIRSRDIHMHARVCARVSITREIHNRPPRILSDSFARRLILQRDSDRISIDARASSRENISPTSKRAFERASLSKVTFFDHRCVVYTYISRS